MENRFLEMDLYLKEVTGKKNGKRGGKRSSASAYGLSFSESTGWAKSLSAQNRSLVILIENEGVDLGIPDLVDKILDIVPMSSMIPDSVRQALINFIRDKIKEFTDNLLETAELTLNRYNAAAPDKFGGVTILRNSTASYEELKNTLINLSKENKIIDLIILTHGSEDSIAVTGGINSKKIVEMKTAYGKPLSIRSVYMMNCKGSTLNQAWLDAGAKVSSGSIQNNYLPEPTTYFFWNNWKDGQSFENAVTGAYRKTINLMNAAVNSFLQSIPVLSSISINFEDFDFVKDSAPMVQGIRSVTINTDDLTFTQSISSGLVTTVLSVNVLKRLPVSKSFGTERTHSWSMSQKCTDMIKSFEGFRSKKYNDPAGHCTIGYGTLLHKGNCNGDASEKPYENGVTEEQATQLLIQEANEFQRTINDSVTVELNQNQYDSLVSFSYNIGSGAFKASTLLKLLNKGDYASVPSEMKKWTKAKVNGKTVDLPGLVKRREDEANLFSAPIAITKSLSYYTRTFSVIDYTVPGTVPVIQQPSRKTCWAAVITMMISWKEKRSIAIRDAIATIGEEYVRMFDDGKILTKETAEKLYKDARLEPIYSYNPSIDGWVDLLQKYGPLYVDIGFAGTMNTHAVIVTGLKGGGTADDTDITYIDPDTGTIKTTLFRNFLQNYETEGAVNWPYTIVHWPAGAFSGTQSIRRGYSRPFYDTGEHAIFGEFINNAISGPIASVAPLLPTTTYLLNTVPYTYGQIITLGDFYETYYDAQGAPVDELKRLKILIERSENHYKNLILGIGKPEKDVGTGDWSDPKTGIGQRYLDLAISNNSHFAPPPAGTKSSLQNNKQIWEEYHGRAIQTARAGVDSSALDAAYPINAFGDHFLTDAFSAGHLINKEIVMNKFINNVMTSGKVNSAGEKMFERIADGALAVPAINKKLGGFEVISSSWYEPNWDLNDTGAFLPEVFYRILIRVMEDTKSGGTKKIANLAAKAIHDYLNKYQSGGVKGVPVRNNKGNSWNLTGDATLNIDNIKIIQLAVKESVENLSDSVTNTATPISTYYKRVWDYVPNLTDPTTSRIVNDAINEFTNPSSDKLIKKAVDLIEDELDTLLNELLKAKLIQCKRKTSAGSVAECQRA